MRAVLFWGVGILLCSGVAQAQDSGKVREHKLAVVDSGTPQPAMDGDLQPPPAWGWPQQHLAAGADFADPFLGPELYPEVSAGLRVLADSLRPTGQVEFSSWLDLQLWLLEVRVPMVGLVDGVASGDQHVRLDLKAPFAIPGSPNHRLALVAGAMVLDSSPSIAQSSHAAIVYGYGGHGVTLQLRGGYGYDQFMPSQPLRLGLLYGAVMGFRAGPFQPMVELDAMRTTRTRSDRITLLPALRIYPGNDDSLQLGLAGLLTFSRGSDTPGKRFGGVFELSYNFL